jgi:DNA-binding IclR family transcriptional regulator
MSRPALAATRSTAILDFLAANPGEAFTLSDLAERLGVNVASMHALLNALTEAGYLARHPRLRTYALGPSVVALGTAALETHPAIDLARDAARDLARETGLEVAVTTVAGDDIVFVARAGEPSPRGVPVHVGQHVPFVPPLGSVFVAWGDGEAWLARAAEPEPLRPILDAVRTRGYSIALEADTRKQLGHALDDLASVPSDHGLRGAVDRIVADLGRREYQVRDLHPGQRYDVSMIAAPVFGPGGEVVLAITLLGFESGLAGAEVAAYGARLRDVALVVTRRTRGRVPPSGAVGHA